MIKWLRRQLGNRADRAIAITTASFCINATLGMGKLLLGVHLLSVWLLLNAGYYLLLCAARGRALQQYRRNRAIADPGRRHRQAHGVFRRSGAFLAALGVVYLLVCMRMYCSGETWIYRGALVYLTAVAALVKLAVALGGNLAMHHLHNPIVSAIKQISFADAMVSVAVTQSALLSGMGAENAARSSAVFGMAVSMVMLGGGLWMLVRTDEAPQNGGERPCC